MISIASKLHKSRYSLLACVGLGVAACGSPQDAIGEGRQPISAAPDATEEDSGGPACGVGVPVERGGPGCQVVARGLCFATADAACACAGCGSDECALAETFPTQAICPSGNVGPNPDGSVSDGNSGSGDGNSGSDGSGNGSNGGGSAPHPGAGSGCDAANSPPDPCGAGFSRELDSRRCDFVLDGLCFEDSTAACACAGCEADACLIRESYPAMVACQ